MNIVLFTHSLTSCWNHGNAHFQRGVLAELASLGHDVRAFEPADGWSLANLERDHGASGVAAAAGGVDERIRLERYHGQAFDVAGALDGAELVIVHEWTEPWLVSAIGRARRGGRFTLLFHDTHHRTVTAPDTMRGLDLEAFDGVLAFGQSLAEAWRRIGWGGRALVWHEAADTRLFRPPREDVARAGLVLVANWGDEERSRELVDMLLAPAAAEGAGLDVWGVRYPPHGLDVLARHGARYRGWLPNRAVPAVYARHTATVHVPRRAYAEQLPGIPTIRVFEALACGLPLVSSGWSDCEGLFRPGIDFLVARNGAEVRRHLRALQHDPGVGRELAGNGLATIRRRHTCRHRALELIDIVRSIRGERRAHVDSGAVG